MYIAAMKGHEAVVERLLAAGAAVNGARSDGKTPLYITEQGKHEAVVGQLRKALAAAATAECSRALLLKRKRSSAGEES